MMITRTLLRRALLLTLCAVVPVSTADAQLLRLSPSNVIKTNPFSFGSDAAYDPVNNVYLVVTEEQFPEPDALRGQFVTPAGTPVGSSFIIASEPADLPRAIYSPQLQNGTATPGGFLVTWADPTHIRARRVVYPGATVGSAVTLGAGYGVQEVAYSPTSGVFGLVWVDSPSPRNVTFARISTSGGLVGSPMHIAVGGHTWNPWNSHADIEWHPTRNEFAIFYTGEGSPRPLRLARISAAGALIEDRVVTTAAEGPHAVQFALSPATGNYIATWADFTTGRITAAEMTADGDLIASAPLPEAIVGGQGGMSMAHNPVSGTFLLVGFTTVTIKAEQARGIELNQHGAPNSGVIDVTEVPLNANLVAPRVAARPDAAEWLIHTVSAASLHYAQIVGTTSAGGGSTQRLDGCYLPDPFASLGGGVCSNGGWVSPVPPPPPPPSTGCSTADPFAAIGGGTCYAGGWLPPGILPPSTPSEPPPSEPPPSTPPPSGGCTTADPFAGMGGGTCYNGGWLPPGMTPPGGSTPSEPPPSSEPPQTPPPPPSTGCTTADPFAAMGGGTCYNGGWLPPGMTPPGGGTPPPATPPPVTPPPPSGTCTTADPFAAIGGGTCYAGGWLPPGMPIPGGGGE